MRLAGQLARALDALHPHQRVLVAVDGPDAAGKTTLADAVAESMTRPVVRVCIDDWHRPRAARLARGPESPEGYYRDSFDLTLLATDCLTAFRDGCHSIRTRAFDHRADGPLETHEVAADDAALLVDGVFLLRPELRDHWDLAIYVHVPEETTLLRALRRDRSEFGSEADLRLRYQRRYLPGQALYRAEADPLARCDVLIDNTDAEAPRLLRRASKPPALGMPSGVVRGGYRPDGDRLRP